MSSLFDKEDLEDTKGVIRIHTSKNNGQHNGLKKKVKRTKKNMYKTQYRKLEIEQHEPH
jgi:peptidyl-tRNA hydrolase